jgi:hypothetical protein
MKTLTVRNLTLQFDADDSENNLEATQQMVDAMNLVLGEQFNMSSPQIFASAIDDSDIEVG